MPTSAEPAGSDSGAGTPPGAMPPSVRVAAIAMGFLAALLLVNAGLLWYGFDVTVERIASQSRGITHDQARRLVLLALIPYLVIGLVLALAAWFLPRRQPWARWLGLGASVLLALLMLFSIVTAGGIAIPSLLLLVLSTAAASSLLARSTGSWVPSLRRRD